MQSFATVLHSFHISSTYFMPAPLSQPCHTAMTQHRPAPGLGAVAVTSAAEVVIVVAATTAVTTAVTDPKQILLISQSGSEGGLRGRARMFWAALVWAPLMILII
jgi:hypothetical protein